MMKYQPDLIRHFRANRDEFNNVVACYSDLPFMYILEQRAHDRPIELDNPCDNIQFGEVAQDAPLLIYPDMRNFYCFCEFLFTDFFESFYGRWYARLDIEDNGCCDVADYLYCFQELEHARRFVIENSYLAHMYFNAWFRHNEDGFNLECFIPDGILDTLSRLEADHV